ncbi:uncharacterized protein CLUP02_18126 [Colletotrichum lupini]|uniref:Uncharacterized protein n=1 Tax=Colletotrichum lupini TaxID=145971 RepID=A0A9Q8WAG4_9PEZI|nr:uncharacterized protein CLUP02_18126 [Colletotrichum lupini]UQC76613.1 hypothetical protein CLUP02_18126 [Colletotrichum lupini]
MIITSESSNHHVSSANLGMHEPLAGRWLIFLDMWLMKMWLFVSKTRALRAPRKLGNPCHYPHYSQRDGFSTTAMPKRWNFNTSFACKERERANTRTMRATNMLRSGISLKRRSGDVEKTPLQRRLRKPKSIVKSTVFGANLQ